MIDHIAIQCSDLSASAAFYDRVLAPLGGSRVMDFGTVIGYGVPPMPDFWLGPHETGTGFRESHIAFTAPDRDRGAGVLRRCRRGRGRGAARAAGVARVPRALLRCVRPRSGREQRRSGLPLPRGEATSGSGRELGDGLHFDAAAGRWVSVTVTRCGFAVVITSPAISAASASANTARSRKPHR